MLRSDEDLKKKVHRLGTVYATTYFVFDLAGYFSLFCHFLMLQSYSVAVAMCHAIRVAVANGIQFPPPPPPRSITQLLQGVAEGSHKSAVVLYHSNRAAT